MSNIPVAKTKTFEFGGQTVTLETGRIARQADGAVLATIGKTQVLATVVAAKTTKPGQDFFPLSVHYQEKMYAAGRIPGGYLKREGRPSEKETLTSRLIDRPIRPLFPEGFLNEVQVIPTVMASEKGIDPDICAMIAVSAALAVSGVPFNGPIGAARVGFFEEDGYVLNPTDEQLDDLFFAWKVAKHVKSNAIVYVKGGATVGVGAGQMSRLDSANVAAAKAGRMAAELGLEESLAKGCAVASDAFFPFPDGLLEAAAAGGTCVIQPGGSMRDDEVIKAANEKGLAMVFTGMRHFRH